MRKKFQVLSQKAKILLQVKEYHKQKVIPFKEIGKSGLRKDIKKTSRRKSIEREVNNMMLDNKNEQK